MRQFPWEREGERCPFCEEHWLAYYKDDVDLPIERYRESIDGYVIYDNEDVIQIQNLAITMAGLELGMRGHGIPAAPFVCFAR